MTATETVDWTVTEPGVVVGMPDDVYLSDPVPGGSLSVSGAKRLLPPSCPAIYQYERSHPRHSDAFDFGKAAHAKVLGTGADVVVIDAEDWRSKKAQQARDEAHEAGKTPLLKYAAETVDAMAEQLARHPVASMLFTGNGQPEVSAFWQDVETGVWRRARFDWLPEAVGGRLIIPDLKTAVTANPYAFEKTAADFLYHCQASWYMDAADALGLAGDVSFLFVIVQKTAPYLVSVVELDGEALRLGDALNRRAIATYADCVASDTWPAWTDAEDVTLVSLPYWYKRNTEDLL